MRCIITSVAELGTPKLLLAVATSFHPGTSTGHGTSLKFSMVADRRAIWWASRVLPLPVGEHITSCLVHLGRDGKWTLRTTDVSFRRFFATLLFTSEDGLFSSAVKHLLWHPRLVLHARLNLQALLTSSRGGHVLLGGIGFFLLLKFGCAITGPSLLARRY